MFNKICKIIKSKKGVTMVELLCAMAISAVILTACVGIIIPTARTAAYNEKLATAKAATSNALTYIQNEMMYASSVILHNEYNTGDENVIFLDSTTNPAGPRICAAVGGGTTREYINEADYFQLNYDMTFEVATDAVTGSPVEDAVLVKFLVTDKRTGEPIYNSQSTIKLLNGGTGSVTGDSLFNPAMPAHAAYIVSKTGISAGGSPAAPEESEDPDESESAGGGISSDPDESEEPSVGGAPAWDAAATYNPGDVVSYNGHEWEYVWNPGSNAQPGIPGVWNQIS